MNEEVKIYVRDSQKKGRVLNLNSKVTGKELFEKAAAAHNVDQSTIALILEGKILKEQDEVALSENAIVHLVTLSKVQKEEITLNVRMLTGETQFRTITIPSNSTIQTFIEEKLSK